MAHILKTTEKKLNGKRKHIKHLSDTRSEQLFDGRPSMVSEEVAEELIPLSDKKASYDMPERDALLQLMETLERFHQNGTLKALQEYAEVLTAMKHSLSRDWVREMAARATQLIERFDDMVQRGALEGLTSLIEAYDQAVLEREAHRRPVSLFRLVRLALDPSVRDKAALALWTLKFWREASEDNIKKDK
ncbi:MAG: hypothetical protein RBR24_03745 [Candidatus Carbobacillus sp.]|nr:hypothetical protein [Candidatus Carbobacillus sp.]